MRIAQRVNIALGARHLALRNVEYLGELRSVEIARRAYLYLGIAALRDQRRKPADFELQADADE